MMLKSLRSAAVVMFCMGLPGLHADEPILLTGHCGSGCAAEGCGSTGWSGMAPSFLDSLVDKSCLGSIIQPSDHCFSDFVSPITNPVFFEDPRTLTEVRPLFVHHEVPNRVGSGIPAGGYIQLYAVQFRAALTDRLSLIAVKDGFIVDETEGALGGLLSDGWADVTAGLKYNFHRDTEAGTLASAGFTYEMPIGSQRALQDIGDGEFHFFLTGGKRFGCGDGHWISTLGYRTPVDQDLQTSAIHWSNHFDYRLTDKLYLVAESVWWHWTDDASNGLALGVAGQDLFNLSSTNVAGNDLVTKGLGLKYKPNDRTEVGVAWEFPLTDFEELTQNRFTFDIIWRL